MTTLAAAGLHWPRPVVPTPETPRLPGVFLAACWGCSGGVLLPPNSPSQSLPDTETQTGRGLTSPGEPPCASCEAIGLATITHTTTVVDGKHKTTRNHRGPVPYHLRHSFASLLIHEGQHSLVQISEWLGHSTATLPANYAHVIADVAGRSLLPSELAIKTARALQLPHTRSNSTGPDGRRAVTRWLYA